jgi:hypothetical protein
VVTRDVTASAVTEYIRPILEQGVAKLLVFTGCSNVYTDPMPPITTWEQWQERLRIPPENGRDQPFYEGWFMQRTGIRNDSTVRATWSQYQQRHGIAIVGMTWRRTYEESYAYIQDQAELIGWTIEKNKGLLDGTEGRPVNEVSEFQARFTTPMQQEGEVYLVPVEITMSALVNIVEPAGRVTG